jgi:hypothetical protein
VVLCVVAASDTGETNAVKHTATHESSSVIIDTCFRVSVFHSLAELRVAAEFQGVALC